MMTRNREIDWLVLAHLAVSGVGIALGLSQSVATGVVALMMSLALGAVYASFTAWRYRQIRQLSLYLSQVYSGGKPLDIRDNREGELSALKNDLYKITAVLERQAEQLYADKDYLTQALANISHQLKTPLAVLKTQASVALASVEPRQWYESLQAMSSTLDNTIQLTERLLQLSAVKRKEQGERHFSPVNLYEVVQTSCFTRLAQSRSKGIDLGYEGEQDAVWVEGDEVLLGELCGNLLDNALKYTPPYGVVTARLQREGEAVVLVVEDSGPGIDEQMVHQALLPFHRLDNVGNVPGAGIGLALVNDIARLHRTHPQLTRSETLGGLRVRVRFLSVTV